MAETLQLGQRATASVKWLNSGGNPASVQGEPIWASSNPAHLSCVPSTADRRDADLQALQTGLVQLQVSVKAGLQGYVTELLDINIIEGEVAGGEIKLIRGPVDPGVLPSKKARK